MANDSSTKSSKKKRKLMNSVENKQRPLKKHRIGDSEKEKEKEQKKQHEECESSKQRDFDPDIEGTHPWRNLQLILLLQNKRIDIHKKIELAFDYVNSRSKEERDHIDDDETVRMSRVVGFLSDWVQSLVISMDKKIKDGGEKLVEACLDYRCWVIFKFCLEESSQLQVPLSLSKNLLRSINCIARHALSLLTDTSPNSKDFLFVGKGFELYDTVLDCVSLAFSSGAILNENMDLWIATTCSVFELLLRIYDMNLENGNAGAFAMRFSCLVIEPFAKFLRVHATRMAAFIDFVDKLLEPLLHLLGVLCLRCDKGNVSWKQKLKIIVEEVLSQGLFHPMHIDVFLKKGCNNRQLEENANTKKRYHTCFFDNLERIMAAKNSTALSGLGELFQLFVHRVKELKVASIVSAEFNNTGTNAVFGQYSAHGSSIAPLESSNGTSNLDAKRRKSVFDFFVRVMKPLLLKMNGYFEIKLDEGSLLPDVHCTLRAINSLLASFFHEKVYVKAEDFSKGDCINFFKSVYNEIISFASSLQCLPSYDRPKELQEILALAARELLAAVACLLDIEYEVIGNDLTNLWFIILCYLAMAQSLEDAPNKCGLESQILQLGCQLITTYSELRQVANSVFALCKAIRSIIVCSNGGDDDLTYGTFRFPSTSVVFSAYSKSVERLLHSQELKSAIHGGINSTPEGQLSECVRQLSLDLSESMAWMKVICPASGEREYGEYKLRKCSMISCGLQAELLGRGLSELYSLVLDSVSVTFGNSILVGRSVEDLMTTIRPCFSILVEKQPDGVNELMSSVTGRDFCGISDASQNDVMNSRMSACWVFVFFFQLYTSCRSLYRQTLSLMPPDASRKMSAIMGDSFTAYSGMDWMDRSYLLHEDYFSWIAKSSASLLVVMRSVSDICLRDGNESCCSLMYALLVIALQRLADLNRQIKSSEYIQESMDKSSQIKLNDSTSSLCRRKRKWRKCVSVMKQEAEGLTKFIMKCLSFVCDDHLSAYVSDNVTTVINCNQAPHDCSRQDLGVCSINKRSFPTAIWWLICQNIDIWSVHARKKKLKVFLTLVIQTSLPILKRSFTEFGKLLANEGGVVTEVTVHQISTVLLTDSQFYQHKFVHRYLASRFCCLLKQSVSMLFNEFAIEDVDLDSSPNWQEALSALENSSMVVLRCNHSASNKFTDEKSVSIESNGNKFRACQSLLGLLCWMLKGHFSSKSFSLYMTHVLNLERFIIHCLLECHSALSLDNQSKLLRLLVSCRRALKYVVTAFSENMGDTRATILPLLSDSSPSLLWLFKSMSLVVGLPEVHAEGYADKFKDVKISLMDHTSHLFLTLTKYRFTCAIHYAIHSNYTNESAQCTDLSKGVDNWDSFEFLFESLKGQTQDIFISFKDVISDEKVGERVSAVHLNKLSSIITCFGGFLWGLAYSLTHTNATESACKVNLTRLGFEPLSRINDCLCMFENFIRFLLKKVVFQDDDDRLGKLVDVQNIDTLDHTDGLLVSREHSLQEQCQFSGVASSCLLSSDLVNDNDTSNNSAYGCNSSSEDKSTVSRVLNKADSFERQPLCRKLLQNLVKGDHPEVALLIRHLLIASSAILRLNVRSSCTSCLSSLVPSFIGISEILLLTLSDMDEVPPFSFVWLDGVLKYLEELGSHFPLTSPALSRNLFVNLIELHIKALGKCIALQGKRAALSSHQSESNTILLVQKGSKASGSHSCRSFYCDEFKARLRLSFKGLITKASELHLLSAIQAVERAVVGVNEDCSVIYEINTGSTDGGHVSSTVAAGVDCMDLILEYVTGRRRLNVLKRHIQNLIAALFNIVLHLQSPLIYSVISTERNDCPDPGVVILMSVEVLARVSAKHALYKLDSWHVAQSLCIPAALFQDFIQLGTSEGPLSSDFFSLDSQGCSLVEAVNSQVVNQQFSVDLFNACCRLLYTVLKHHKSESERSIALLQESVCILLNCLEMANNDLSTRKGFPSWGLQEGEQCACSLRRIYEELRQQKDIFGRHCFKFLSDYILVYSGFGHLKTNLRREVDTALKPGVYALIDCCSADDLQYLHTAFGEGPCRTTLANLQHDYKINFKYEGKV